MKLYIAALFSISLMVLFMPSCIDPTEIGSELLDQDLIDVGFTDTITLVSTTVKGDSVRTHQYLTYLDGYLLGDFKDPFFGRSTASFYGQVGMIRTASGVTVLRPDFDGMVLDSAILVMGLDSNYFYGNVTYDHPFVVRVSQLANAFDPIEDLYSNAIFQTVPDGIGLPGETIFEIFPRFDTISVDDYSSGIRDTVSFPHIRLKLPNQFGQKFLEADSLVYVSDSSFVDFFPGFSIEPISENDGLLALDLLVAGSDAVAGLYLYFSPVGGGDPAQYRFPFNSYRMRTATLKNDHFASPVGDYINNPDRDTLVFMQGMEGLYTKLDLPFVTDNKGLIVNKAELVLTIAELPGFDYDIYAPVERILVSTLDEDGNLGVISDVSFATDLDASYGGTIVRGTNGQPDSYKINISSHMQDMIDGVEPPVLYLTTYRRALKLGQVAIYGGSHGQYPIKINLHFTRQ